MDIKKIVKQLSKKYATNNPFKLCELLGIVVVFEQLGSIYGYYSKTNRFKVIHINENLPYLKQLSTCAHELGHAILHPEENTAFLKAYTYFPTSKIEAEANEFMLVLLFNQDLSDSITLFEVIKDYGISSEILSLNYRNIKNF